MLQNVFICGFHSFQFDRYCKYSSNKWKQAGLSLNKPGLRTSEIRSESGAGSIQDVVGNSLAAGVDGNVRKVVFDDPGHALLRKTVDPVNMVPETGGVIVKPGDGIAFILIVFQRVDPREVPGLSAVEILIDLERMSLAVQYHVEI